MGNVKNNHYRTEFKGKYHEIDTIEWIQKVMVKLTNVLRVIINKQF